MNAEIGDYFETYSLVKNQKSTFSYYEILPGPTRNIDHGVY